VNGDPLVRGLNLVELVDHRITEMAARCSATYPVAMKCLLADRGGSTAYLRSLPSIASGSGIRTSSSAPSARLATNHGSTWTFRDADKPRTIENPVHFTDIKAKELKSQLEKAARKLRVKEPLPRIEAAVFLSAENLKSRLDEFQRQRVYDRDNLTASTGLGGIWAGFLNQPPRSERISYPGASPDSDSGSLLIGWAGWTTVSRPPPSSP
jgi:hypothetical protein